MVKGCTSFYPSFLSGPNKDRSSGWRWDALAGRQNTMTLFATAVLISPSTIRIIGGSFGAEGKNKSRNYLRYMSLSIQPDFWLAKKVPWGASSFTDWVWSVLKYEQWWDGITTGRGTHQNCYFFMLPLGRFWDMFGFPGCSNNLVYGIEFEPTFVSVEYLCWQLEETSFWSKGFK